MLRPLVLRLRALFHARSTDQELDEELRFHLEAETERLVAHGMNRDEARFAARRAFGNVSQARESARQTWGWTWLEHLGQDVRHSARVLRRNAGFTLAVLLTLTLGIGANAAVFGVVRGVLLRPLSYPEPERVVTLWSTNRARGWVRGGVSRQDADDWIGQSRSFVTIGTYTALQGNMFFAGEPQRVKVALASSGMFRALGVTPVLGRALTADDDRPGHGSVAVVSHTLWLRTLGASPSAVGRTVTLDGRSLTVVGVMPEGFDFPDATTAIWTPFGASPDETGPRVARWVEAVARLRPAVTLEAAQAEMQAIAERLANEYPASNRDVGVLVETRLSAMTGDVRTLLLVAWGMVALVLIIVVTNSAQLLLTRAAAREGEVAVRSALGAGRVALARQFLVESMLLSLGGGVLGATLAVLATPLLRRLGGLGIPRAQTLAIDPWVLVYALAAALVVGLAFGVAPALGAARTAPADALRGGGRGVMHGRERLRAALIVVQVALAVVVLVCTGLLFRSFARVSRVEPGFALTDRVTFRIAPDWQTIPQRPQAEALYEQLFVRLRALPGVTDVAAVNRLPLTGSWWTTEYEPEGHPAPAGKEPTAGYRVVTPGYFATMAISLLRGRALVAGDGAAAQRVTVVSRSFADRAWPGRDPIGERVSFSPGETEAPQYTVVGVVGDVHSSGLADAAEPLAYIPFTRARFGHFGDWGMDVVVHTSLAPEAIIAGARRELAALAPALPLYDARPLTALVGSDLARRRLLLIVLGILALTAIALAGLGLYGVIAYAVAQRRPELGLRMALGADTGVVWRGVVTRGLMLAVVGAAIGVAGAGAATRLLGALLYAVTPLDAVSFATAPTAMLLVAFMASWIPASRACRVDPVEALKGN